MGSRGYADLMLGSNHYYTQYFRQRSQTDIDRLVEAIVDIRKQALISADAAFSLIVPSKASCLPENYPMFLPRHPTAVFEGVRRILEPYGGSGFAPWMTEGSFDKRRQFWFKFDSHWNSVAARSAAEWLVSCLGIEGRIEIASEPAAYGGDLSCRWDAYLKLEESTSHEVALLNSTCIADNGHGVPYSANSGRMVEWANPYALIDARMLVVGDSFSGAGYNPWNLTYWLSRYFTETTFIHAFNVPVDLFSTLQPRFFVYQTNERFLVRSPNIVGSVAQVLEEFEERHGMSSE